MTTADDVRYQALALTAEERASLARDLLLSLESAELDLSVEQEWAAEVERRAEAYARGETTASDWRESVERTRRALAARRKS